ncbi:dentin sialophosphoprotein-like isoform X2 [Pistacia vera]|uniref:dentin sialophosphoprotein-like isoform X2 n=1 Tax=Pistacia vera TaxID=55513 RepID=UPI0012633F83|nr:dentin sialophosphoprotein-like isoform X2 [Pistacia vera]
MDKNIILAVFLLFFVVADVSNAKFRHLAAVDPNNNSATTQVSGANKPVEAGNKKKPEAVGSSSQLDSKELNKRDLVSPPPPNETTDNSKSSNTADSVNPNVQNKTSDNPNGSNNTDNSKNSNVKDSSMSHPDKEKSMNNSSDTAVSTQVKGTDNGKNGGMDREKNGGTDNRKKDGTDSSKDVTDNGKKDGTDGGKKDGTDSGKKGGTDSGKKDGTDSGKEGTDSGKDETDSGKKDKTKENNNEDKRDSESGVDETCLGLPNRCSDMSGLIACIKSFDTGSRNWTVLVQNEGEKTLRVNLTVPTAAENPLKQLEISKHKTEKIIISSAVGKSNKVIFNTRSGECVLHMNSVKSGEKFFVYLPSYENLLSPINGAYFLILSVLILGGTWACCKLRKRRRHDGVPYQELEMGLPESASATNVETAEGWDEVWDDDWDDNNAVKSPAAPHMGNISANGLTSRSTTKDGWEHDWDD